MNKVVIWLKSLRPLKMLAVFVAGMFLVFTQACTQATATKPEPTRTTPPHIVGPQSAEPNSEVYVPKGDKPLNTYEGGMNNFSDLDPRGQGADVKAKSEALKQNAEQNVIDQTSNLGENTRRILEKKGENAEDFGKNVQRSVEKTADKAQGTAEDFAKGTKQGLENIQDNTKDAAKGAAKNVQGAAEGVKIDAQRKADNAGDAVERTVREAGDNANTSVRDTGNNLIEKAQQAVENAGNFVQGKS